MGPGPPPWNSDTATYQHPPSPLIPSLDPDLSHHIQNCACPCNHLGYGGSRTPRPARKIPEDKVLPATPQKTPSHIDHLRRNSINQFYDVRKKPVDHRTAAAATQTPDPCRRVLDKTLQKTTPKRSVSSSNLGTIEMAPNIPHAGVHHHPVGVIPPQAKTTYIGPPAAIQTPNHHARTSATTSAGNYFYVDYERIHSNQLPSPSPSARLQQRASPIRYWQAGANNVIGRNAISQLTTHHQRRYFAQHDDSYSTASSEDEPNFHRRPWCLCAFMVCLVIALGSAILIPNIIGKPLTGDIPVNVTSTPLNGVVAKNKTNKYSTYSQAQRLQVIKQLLKKSPLIDAHNDLPWNIRKFVHNRLRTLDLSKGLKNTEPWATSPWSQTDIPRMRAGLIGAQFWSAYVPCESQYLDAVQLTLEQIDVVKRLVSVYKKDLELVYSAKEIIDVYQTGKIASLIGIEGGHSLGSSMGVLRSLYDLGARYVTLTHTCDTPWAESSSLHESGFVEPMGNGGDPGLTTFGLSIIREMNRLGMMVDLSHTSVATIRAALNVTKAPVLFSHSSAYAVCNSTRNVPDDLLKLLAKNRGVVMVNFYANLVNCNGSNIATMQDVIEHIKHIRNIAGVDYVGLGAGYDGINATPSGLSDVSKYPQLLSTLLAEPGWTDDDILKIAGKNLLRVFEEVETIRDGWKLAAVPPAEDVHPPHHLPEDVPKCQYEHQHS